MNVFKILFFSFTVLFFSCDYVDNPSEEGSSVVEPSDEKRRVLLMDFTGHKCQNCPSAAAEAQSIADDFPESVVVLAVHPNISGLSDPNDGEPGEPYTTNWITPEGLDYQAKFDIPTFIPLGVVSGEIIGGNFWTPPASWRPNVELLLQDDRQVTLELELSYDEGSREIGIVTDLEVLTPLDNSYGLIIATVESGIIDWQLNGSTAVPDYEHNHVLRNHVNGIQGEEVITDGSDAGEQLNFTHSSILDSDFVAENVYIYAYLYDIESLEVLDVVEKHIIE